MNTVLIATESTAFGNLLSRRLEIETDISVAGIAYDAKELMATCQDTQPDVLLLNLEHGGKLIRNVKHLSPSTQVVVIVQDRTAHNAREAMRAGAQDILCAGELF